MFCFLKVNFTTVIGILKGTKFGTKDDAILGVGAHYDTVNTTKGKHNIWENSYSKGEYAPTVDSSKN
jgi:hypothetical protein